MHWEIHITEFQNFEGKLEPCEKVHAQSEYKLRDYDKANSAFKTLNTFAFPGMKIFHNGLTKVGISDRFGTNRWYMLALTLEKGWAK